MKPPFPADVNDFLALNLVPGIGPRLTAALLTHFGAASRVRSATAAELREVPHIGEQLAARFAAALHSANPEAETEKMIRHDTGLLLLGWPEYPAPLASITNAPPVLYVRGEIVSGDARAVAIVGSRRCTPYGKRVAERLAADLARAGVTVISGLARGIDAAAHRGALNAGGRTLAVLAGGLSRIYPPEHKELAVQVQNAGALISEAAMDAEPLPMMFPARNRIISGLSRAVVLVEAAERSGAIITADHGVEQGRLVFAVPGPVDSEASAGVHALLRDGAILCRGAADILQELDGFAAEPVAPPVAAQPVLDPMETRIFEVLAARPRHLDDLVAELGTSVPRLAGILLGLEMKKLIRRMPGNRYERV